MADPAAIKSYRNGNKATVMMRGSDRPPPKITDKYGNEYRLVKFPNASGAASISRGGLNYLYTKTR